MAIEHEFSAERIKEYAGACFSIAESLVGKSEEVNFNTLLIPSRGAVPFFIGSMYALHCLSKEYEDYRNLTNRINVPKLIREYVVPADAVSSARDGKSKINILLCPFTADINMQPFAQDIGIEGRLSVDEFVNDTRRYWTKVVHGLTEGKKRRAEDQFLQFYLYLLRDVENRPELAREYEDTERVDGVVMIDTVISGRASMTILDAFKQEKKTPYSLLVVDNNGKSLKEPYKTKIRNGEVFGSIRTIPIQRIFTEDRGASLEGVVGVVYPSLMFFANELQFKDGPFSPVGAGSWHHLPKNNPHEAAFRSFCEMLKSAVAIGCADYVGCIDKGKEEQNMTESRERLLGILKSEKLLIPNHVSASYIKTKYPIQKTYETGSHVVHLCFTPEISRAIVNDFKRKFNQNR